MATALQFLARPNVRPVVVVAGRSAALQAVVVEALLARLDYPPTERYDAAELSLRAFRMRLAQPVLFSTHEVLIYENCSPDLDTSSVMSYLADPDLRRTLVFTAPEIRGTKGTRVIPSDPRVLYIDCSHLEEEGLLKFCRLNGLNDGDAQWLVRRVNGDMPTILRMVDLLNVFPQPWPQGLVQRLQPQATVSSRYFECLSVLYNSDASLLRQLRRRLGQLAQLSEILGNASERLSVVDLARRIETEPFIISRILPLAKQRTPVQWLALAAEISRADTYVQRGVPAVPEYLKARLSEVLDARELVRT